MSRRDRKPEKKPLIGVDLPNPKRQPRVPADNENSDASYPIWRLHLMDIDGPWHWNLDAAKLREIRDKLAKFETMRWAEINGKRNHFLSAESVSKEAVDRLIELQQDDAQDLLYSLSFSGEERLVGIRCGREFRILWWDPEHQVCPSHLKHT